MRTLLLNEAIKSRTDSDNFSARDHAMKRLKLGRHYRDVARLLSCDTIEEVASLEEFDFDEAELLWKSNCDPKLVDSRAPMDDDIIEAAAVASNSTNHAIESGAGGEYHKAYENGSEQEIEAEWEREAYDGENSDSHHVGSNESEMGMGLGGLS